MSTSTHYATSLSDEQWHVLQLMLPEPKLDFGHLRGITERVR